MPSSEPTHLSEFTEAARVLRTARHVIVFTADGLSEEGGVPPLLHRDTRWQGKSPGALSRLSTFEKNPKLVWEWYHSQRRIVDSFEPSAAHYALARLEAWCALGLVGQPKVSLITYSTFGFHGKANQLEYREARGSIWKNRCTSCKKERICRDLQWTSLPLSPCCDALERPAVAWIDEIFDVAPDESNIPPSLRGLVGPSYVPSVRLIVGSGFERFAKDDLWRMYKGDWIKTIKIHPEAQETNEDCIFLSFPAQRALPQLLELVVRNQS